MRSRSDSSSTETPVPRPSNRERPPDAAATWRQASAIRLTRSARSSGGRTESPALMAWTAVSKISSAGRARSHSRSWTWAGEVFSTPRSAARRRTVSRSGSVTLPSAHAICTSGASPGAIDPSAASIVTIFLAASISAAPPAGDVGVQPVTMAEIRGWVDATLAPVRDAEPGRADGGRRPRRPGRAASTCGDRRWPCSGSC